MNRIALALGCGLLCVWVACPSSTPRDFSLPPPGTRVPGFLCGPERCVQEYPRTPDDGDWSCAGSAGASVCLGGTVAAGVADAPANPGWRCGDVAGRPPQQRRVCVDVKPDFPPGGAQQWRCHYQNEIPIKRICDKVADNAVLGAACSAALPCVDGAICVQERCEVPTGNPYCWVDADCGSKAVCRFGGCLAREGSR